MTQQIYSTINKCRICASSELTPILNLGNQPPANSLRTNPSDVLPKIPLSISRCEKCALIQLNESVNPEYLFRNYFWVTGTTDTAKTYSHQFYQGLKKQFPSDKKLFVIEVASNDGTFLKVFRDGGHKILGVDPARNIAEIAVKNGIPTISEFFGSIQAGKITEKEGTADCVFARNVIPHVENVHDVVSGMALCLNDQGVGAIEFHNASTILDELHYDSIYHEHLCYFSIKSITYLLKQYGLFPFDIMNSPISGGSRVLYFCKKQRSISELLEKAVAAEMQAEVNNLAPWHLFAKISFAHKDKLNAIIQEQILNNERIIGYGASARSSTLLNFCGIDSKILSCIADKNIMKHGKLTPGSDIPIVDPQKAFSQKPSVVVLLAWNFAQEILETIKKEFQFKGQVIVPLPHDPKIITLS